MNKQLDLDFVNWLWAVNRGMVNEYYKDNYGTGTIDFTVGIGGCIVKEFFQENADLLQRAYNIVFQSWQLLIWSIFPDTQKQYSLDVKLNYNTMTWVLFKSLAYNLQKDDITKYVGNSDWLKVWEELDKKYEVK